MSASRPLVSILINNYNYGRFLRDAIDSALHQTYPNTEVIVVDDGSTDDSRAIIASYRERVIPVLKDNGGQASAFNAGFAASRGEWIFLLDSDDIFLPEKAERALRLAEQNPGVGLIAHNLDYCGIDGAPIDFLPPVIQELRLVDDRKRVRRGKVSFSLPAPAGLCFRRDVIGEILPMPEAVRGQPDNYVKCVALSLTPVLLVPKTLAKQRIHDRNHYTSSYRDHGELAQLRRALFSAEVCFHLKKYNPLFSRLAWKQYGRNLYQLTQARSDKAREARAAVRSRYSVMDLSPVCLFYVAGAFTKAFVKNLLQVHFHA